MNVTNALDIDWDKVDPIYKFAAMDAGGWVSLYTECPVLGASGWYELSFPESNSFYSLYLEPFLKAPAHWEDTLTERPAKGVVK